MKRRIRSIHTRLILSTTLSEGWIVFIEPGDRMLPNLKKLHYGKRPSSS